MMITYDHANVMYFVCFTYISLMFRVNVFLVIFVIRFNNRNYYYEMQYLIKLRFVLLVAMATWIM